MTSAAMIEPAFPIPAVGASHVQVTANGEWETATRLASRGEALDYLAGFGAEAVGVELLWEGPPVSFVGARLVGGRVSELPELVATLTVPGLSPIAALDALSGGNLGELVVAECGAVNAWRSVGPARLWDGAAWVSPTAALAGRPELRACAHPVALEVGHREAWYAVEVSRRTDAAYAVDLAELTRLAGLVERRLRPGRPSSRSD